jgi:large subunit ribosomal protein L35
MPKLKTKQGVTKRFKLTKKGKLKYHSGGKRHLSTSKKTKQNRNLRKAKTLENKKEAKYVKRMLPYG